MGDGHVALKFHRGKFRISLCVLDRALNESVGAKQLQSLFAKIIPVSVQCDYMRQELVVEGFSPHFDEVKEGESVPEYEAICNTENDAWFKRG